MLSNFKSSLKVVISSSGDLSLDRKSVFDILILNVNKINSQLFTTGNYQEFQETGPEQARKNNFEMRAHPVQTWPRILDNRMYQIPKAKYRYMPLYKYCLTVG